MLKGYGWVGGRLVALKILETPRVKIPVFYLTLGLDLRLKLELEKEKIFLAFVSKLLQTVREIR